MSLASYRAAPPRDELVWAVWQPGCFALRLSPLLGGCSAPLLCCGLSGALVVKRFVFCPWRAWRRPTLPRLKTQYHRRWGVSRPSSGWDRVGPPCYDHQACEGQKGFDLEGHEESAVGFRTVWSGYRAWGALRLLAGLRSSADRAISTGRLRALPRFDLRPIDVVVYHGSQARPGLEVGFPLRCLQRLSRPHIATRLCRWRDNRSTRGASIPVLSY